MDQCVQVTNPRTIPM